MTNAEWAIENSPEIFKGFDCPECSKNDENGHCTRPEDADFDKRECAKGHVAWLMQPRESTSEGEGSPVSVSEECEPAEKESAPVTDADSRERIEADVQAWCFLHNHDERIVLGWLDRQAAITRRETVTECDQLRKTNGTLCQSLMDAEHERDELKERVAELEDDNDYLQRKLLGFEDEVISLESDRDDLIDHRESLEKHVRELEEENFAWRDWKKVAEHMQSDRDYWRDLYMQSRAENAPETPERVCDTCKHFKRVSESLGDCLRYPREVEKAPDDWCGEWSA